ncbi:2 TM domain-containing transmembrane protein [Acrasis kona]|uniref:2 TM domain-containing transmembrane protein n=1 Tax=Acrasis kona TaxID=1008807 RepID=A0AAW2ZQ26_9EUKA
MFLKRTPLLHDLINDTHKYISDIDKDIIIFLNTEEEGIPFDVVKRCIRIYNDNSEQKRYFQDVIKGSDVYFKPEAPKKKTAIAEARLAVLRKKLADLEYADSIKNLTVGARGELNRDPFSSYKGQMGVGLDLIVTLFTFFVLFYWLASFTYPGVENTSFHLISGLLGLVLGLIIDAVLIVIRSDHHEEKKKRGNDRAEATLSLVGKTSYNTESVTKFIQERDRLEKQSKSETNKEK